MEIAFLLLKQNGIMLIYLLVGYFLFKKELVSKQGSADMGQEFTGIFALRVHEPAGTVIQIQTGEILQRDPAQPEATPPKACAAAQTESFEVPCAGHADGNFYNSNLRSAKSEYYYVSDGTEKTMVPHFTFFGYHYVKVEGVAKLKKEDFKGLALYSDLEFTGRMETYMQTHGLPDAFLMENYQVSMGFLTAAQRLGLKLPDQVKLVGIDEIPSFLCQMQVWCRYGFPTKSAP